MPWVKMYTEMLDDTKLGRLNNALRWRFVSLILLAGECDAEGYLTNGTGAMSTDDIAWRLRSHPAKLAKELATLVNVGLVANTDGGWQVIKFAERQGRSQSEQREMWRKRQAKHRHFDRGPSWNEEEISENVPETPEETPPVTRDSRVTHAPRVEEEKSREEEDKDIGAKVPAPKVSVVELTPAQNLFMERWGSKRLNAEQKAAIAEMENQYGLQRVTDGVVWAREKNMALGQAIGSIRTALKNWGTKRSTNGHSAPPSKPKLTPEEVSRLNAELNPKRKGFGVAP